jgi:hypothetical protein
MSNSTPERVFISCWQKYQNPTLVAQELNVGVRAVLKRRARLALRGIRLETMRAANDPRISEWSTDTRWTFPRVINLDIDTGTVVVSSDHHYWPGDPSLAHRALIAVIKLVKPRIKVLNGDIFDGGGISRHPPFGWATKPTAAEELEVCQERVAEIERALPKGCERIWNVGNHCIRFERSLAMVASGYAGIKGMRLADHFQGWDFSWSLMLNPNAVDPVMVKHRNAGGVHAAYNNTMKGGLSIVTGHTHLLESKPWGDYRGRRWGVQTGTLADMSGPQFEYMENGPTAACSGFAVLTFKDGVLMPPELVECIRGKAYFRGQIVAEDAS